MTADPPTCVVQLTPSGRGAIASCLVTGPRAGEMVEALVATRSGQALTALPPGRLAVGRWRGSQPEEVVAVRRTPQEVLIHCHGGLAAISVVLGDLAAAGASRIEWQQWIARREADPLAAEAAVALSHARTERTAAILLDQFHGALRGELCEIVALLRSGDDAAPRIDRLLARAALGRHLTEPFRVVLCGEPNVGKSSLINALVGYRRAIVHEEPGTTRDVVAAATALDGWPVELFDTAGLRPTGDAVEAAGMEAARRHSAAADLRLLVFDRSEAFGPDQRRLAGAWPDALLVHNKSDLAPHADPRPPGIATSAVSGAGLEGLMEAIVARLVADPPALGEAVAFSERHVAALAAAAESLRHGNLSASAAAIEQLLRG